MIQGHAPRFFTAEEVVPKLTHTMLKAAGVDPFLLIDPRLLIVADRLRERYGKLIINDWTFGGELELSGWRPGDCKTGAKYSQHKFGRAFDFHPQEATVEEIRHDLLVRPDRRCYEFISAVEKDVAWLHIDVRNNNTGKIIWFGDSPKNAKEDDTKDEEVKTNHLINTQQETSTSTQNTTQKQGV